jgi:hypothetical protein
MFQSDLTEFHTEHKLRDMEHLDRATIEHVHRAMERAGVTLDVLAAVTGIPTSVLRRRMAGARPFTIRELGLIARALGCRVGELVAEAPPPPALSPGQSQLRFRLPDAHIGAQV